MHKHSAAWARTHRALSDARAALPTGVDAEPLELFDSYLTHNELALAFDVLVFVAGEAEADTACWQALLAAVQEMGLRDDDDLYGRSVLRVIEHTTAQE